MAILEDYSDPELPVDLVSLWKDTAGLCDRIAAGENWVKDILKFKAIMKDARDKLNISSPVGLDIFWESAAMAVTKYGKPLTKALLATLADAEMRGEPIPQQPMNFITEAALHPADMSKLTKNLVAAMACKK